MQKVLMFTREEVVNRLECAATELLQSYMYAVDNGGDFVEFIELRVKFITLLQDIEYFDVFINKSMFSSLVHARTEINEVIVEKDNNSNAVKELAEIKAKLASFNL